MSQEIQRAPQAGKFRTWSIVQNNPEEYGIQDTSEFIDLAYNNLNLTCARVQAEIGTNGNYHFQGIIRVEHQIRHDTLHAIFPHATVQVAENPIALWNYCGGLIQKDGEIIQGSQMQAGDMLQQNAPRGLRVRDLKREITDEEKEDWTLYQLSQYNKLKRWYDKTHLSEAYQAPTQWRPWQEALLKLLDKKPDQRKIIWIYDSIKGNSGKSTLTKYLIHKKNANLFRLAKRADLLHAHNPQSLINIGIYDQKDVEHINYGVIADIKDGYYIDGKFESCRAIGPIPHVVIFANYPPKRCTEGGLTDDKYALYNIENPLGQLIHVDIRHVESKSTTQNFYNPRPEEIVEEMAFNNE